MNPRAPTSPSWWGDTPASISTDDVQNIRSMKRVDSSGLVNQAFPTTLGSGRTSPSGATSPPTGPNSMAGGFAGLSLDTRTANVGRNVSFESDSSSYSSPRSLKSKNSWKSLGGDKTEAQGQQQTPMPSFPGFPGFDPSKMPNMSSMMPGMPNMPGMPPMMPGMPPMMPMMPNMTGKDAQANMMQMQAMMQAQWMYWMQMQQAMMAQQQQQQQTKQPRRKASPLDLLPNPIISTTAKERTRPRSRGILLQWARRASRTEGADRVRRRSSRRCRRESERCSPITKRLADVQR